MDVCGRTFEPSLYAILEAIESSRFVSIKLKLSGSPPAITPINPTFGAPSLEQRYAEIKTAAETYQILQFGLTCAREDRNKKRFAFTTYNFNLRPVPDRTLHIHRNIRLDSTGPDVSSLKLPQVDYCFAKGIPYCSRDEVDHARTVEYGEGQNSKRENEVVWKQSMFGTRGNLLKGLEEFFFISNEDDRVRRLRARRLDRSRGPYSVPVKNDAQRKLVGEIVKADFPELYIIKDKSLGIEDFVHVQIKAEWYKQMEGSRFEDRLRSQTGFRFADGHHFEIVEALCPQIDAFLDPKAWTQLGFDLDDCVGMVLTPTFTNDVKVGAKKGTLGEDKRKGDRSHRAPGHVKTSMARILDLKVQYSMLISALRDKKLMLVGDNLLVDLVYIFHSFFGPLPTMLQEFLPIMKAMFPLIVDIDYLSENMSGASWEHAGSQEGTQKSRSSKIFQRYPIKTHVSDAGNDSYQTTMKLLTLAVRPDDADGFIHPADSEFWDQFGNRLTVTGTQEAVLSVELDPPGLDSTYASQDEKES